MDWPFLVASNTPLLWIRIFTFALELIHQSLQVRYGLKMLIDIRIMSLPKFLVLPVHPLDPPPAGDNLVSAPPSAGNNLLSAFSPVGENLLSTPRQWRRTYCPPLAGVQGVDFSLSSTMPLIATITPFIFRRTSSSVNLTTLNPACSRSWVFRVSFAAISSY